MKKSKAFLEHLMKLYGKEVDPSLTGGSREEIFRRLAERASELSRVSPGYSGAGRRWEDKVIARVIPNGASVLDLGCGGGELLQQLILRKGIRGQGVELDSEAVLSCMKRAVPVIQADLDSGLKGFPDQSFDYVVLEETLQTVHQPMDVLTEMLRVGRHGIVSFPNFAHLRVRLDLAIRGKMPVTKRLPYQWYNTPNIHLFTIQDFLDWTAQAGVRVVSGHVLVEGKVRKFRKDDNLNAEEATMVVSAVRTHKRT